MKRTFMLFMLSLCLLTILSCTEGEKMEATDQSTKGKVNLITLDPGHYHAALVQKSMYDQVNPTVFVYAPNGPDVRNHTGQILRFNNRPENPTHWLQEIYTGDDFLEKMVAERRGDIVVLSGKNRRKTEYIKASIDAGLNVFCDKPMCISPEGFEVLKQAFDTARRKNLLLYDIMTERYNVTCILQKQVTL